jgi:hypothetical protein
MSMSGREGAIEWATLAAGPRCRQQGMTGRSTREGKINPDFLYSLFQYTEIGFKPGK